MWYIVRDGKEEGPFTSSKMKEMAAGGTISRADKVRRHDMNAITTAAKIRGLFPDAPPPIPPLPLPPSNIPATKALSIAACLLIFVAMLSAKVYWMRTPRHKNAEDAETSSAHSVGSKRANGEILTADYYPYRNGLYLYRDGVLELPEGTFDSTREYHYKGNGEIAVRWVHAATRSGVNMMHVFGRKNDVIKHRERGGFVEVTETDKATGESHWLPYIKVGAMVGDQWQRKLSNGNLEKFMLVRFEDKRICYKKYGQWEDVRAAVISRELVTKGIPIEGELVLAKGVGPKEERWYNDEAQGKLLVSLLEIRDSLRRD